MSHSPPDMTEQGESIQGQARDNELRVVAERLRQSLARQEIQFQQIIDHIPFLIYLRNQAGRFLMVNAFFTETLGLDHQTFLESPIEQVLSAHPGLGQLIQGDEDFLNNDGQAAHQERSIVDTHGALRVFQTHKLPQISYNNDDNLLLCVAADVTHLKRSEQAQQVAGLGYWDWNISTGTLEWSDEIYRIFAIDPKKFDASYEAFLNAVHPEDRDKVTRAVTKSLEEDTPYSIDHRIVQPDGNIRTVHEQGAIDRDTAGNPTHMLGTVLDITEQKRAEKALQAIAELAELSSTENFFQTCATHLSHTYGSEYAYIGVFADQPQTRIRTLAFKQGDHFLDNFEYDLSGTPCQDVCLNSTQFIPTDVTMFYPEGKVLNCLDVESYYGAPILDNSGQQIGVVGVLDTNPMELNPWTRPVLSIFAKRISLELERQQQFDALYQAEQFLDNIIENMPMALYVKDAETRKFLRVNQAAEALYGGPRENIIGKGDEALFSGELLEWHKRLENQAIENDTSIEIPSLPFETLHQGTRQLHVQKFPIHDKHGKPEYLVGIAEDITEQETTQRLLQNSLAMQQAIFDSAKVSIISTDTNGVIQSFNAGAEAMLGYSAEEMVGINTPEVIHYPQEVIDRARSLSEELDQPIAPGFEVFVAKPRRGIPEELEWTYIRKDGSQVPVLLSVTSIINEEGDITGFVSVALDISAQKQAEADLRLVASVFDNSIEGIMITAPDSTILRVNQAFTDITGYTEQEAIGQTPRLLRSDRHSQEFYEGLWHSLNSTGIWRGEIWNRRKSGEVFPEWSNICAIKDNHGKTIRYVNIFTDITEKKLSEERIHKLAHYDVITNLPNRTLFNERLEQALVYAIRQQQKMAVMYLDLDGFKLINDTLGHLTGDELLQQVATRLIDCLRSGDTVARLGGDEFAILLTDLAHRNDVAHVAEKILDTISSPYHLGAHEALISTSIGISVFPGDGDDVTTLIRHADTAMYQAKEKGKNTYRYYTSEMNVAAMEHLMLRNELRQAMDRGELSLHYQPQVDLKSGEIFGAEALARWFRPDGESIPPGHFIAVAEESGLIIPLGIWVIRTACLQLKAWHEMGHPHLHMAINLSRRQFNDPRLVNNVQTVLEETGVNPEYLEFEITESFLMESPDQTADILRQFKAMGIEISIDDFGIAYSSLSQLKHFPIDRLKIDRSFVRDIPEDKDDEAITSAIIAMGHSLNLRVIAEGVETREQLGFLSDQFCDEIQGYLFSKPLPADEFLALINDNKTLYD